MQFNCRTCGLPARAAYLLATEGMGAVPVGPEGGHVHHKVYHAETFVLQLLLDAAVDGADAWADAKYAAACRSLERLPLLPHRMQHVRLGELRNAALYVADSAPQLILAASPSERLPRQPHGSAQACSSLHRVVLFSHSCQARPSDCQTPRLLAELPPLQPSRACRDVLNFRGNGPEDPRLLPIWKGDDGQTQLLVLVNDTITQNDR